MVTGSKAAYAADVEKEYQKMGKEKTSILKINDVADVMQEAVSHGPTIEDASLSFEAAHTYT